jgi:hypothetical protein
MCTELIDGKPDAVRAYLRYFWSHWSAPGYEPAESQLDHLVSVYAQPGAFDRLIPGGRGHGRSLLGGARPHRRAYPCRWCPIR